MPGETTEPETTEPETTEPETTEPEAAPPQAAGSQPPDSDHNQPPGSDHNQPPGYKDHRDAYLKRLRRIEGQIRGLQRMVERDEYCIDVLTQVSAATRALESLALAMLDEHLGHCVTRAIATGGEEADLKLREASAAIARLVKS